MATAERIVFLFDDNGEKRDKFSTKPADAKVRIFLLNINWHPLNYLLIFSMGKKATQSKELHSPQIQQKLLLVKLIK